MVQLKGLRSLEQPNGSIRKTAVTRIEKMRGSVEVDVTRPFDPLPTLAVGGLKFGCLNVLNRSARISSDVRSRILKF